MDSKQSYTSSFAAALLVVLRRVLFLIFVPYKTMRKISLEKDLYQVGILFGFVALYYICTGIYRFPSFLITFFLPLLFIYYAGRLFDKKLSFTTLLQTFSYALVPTLIWFYTNYILYLLLPPPRSPSILGKSFSIVYISFSVSLLCWKIILTYLAMRFSLKKQFFFIMYYFLLYTVLILTLTYILYVFGLSKVPFV